MQPHNGASNYMLELKNFHNLNPILKIDGQGVYMARIHIKDCYMVIV